MPSPLAVTYNLDIRPTPPWSEVSGTVTPSAPTSITVPSTGGKDYPGFGDLAIDTAGVLHLVYRWGSDHNSTNDGDIAYRTSSDGGATWSSQTVIHAHGGESLTDPCICVTATGRLIVQWVKSEAAAVRTMWQTVSDDDGASWSSAALMTNLYPDPGQITGPGAPIQTSYGLVKAVYARGGSSGRRRPFSLLSTDDGDSWSSLGTIHNDINPDYEEPCIVERPDGLLIALLRSDPLTRVDVTWSPDGGVRWALPRYVLDAKGKPAVACSSAGLLVAITRKNSDGGRTVYCVSNDGGYTWSMTSIDTETGLYVYGGIVWDHVRSRFCAVYATEVGTPYTATIMQSVTLAVT